MVKSSCHLAPFRLTDLGMENFLNSYPFVCLLTEDLIHHSDRGTKVKKLPHKFMEIYLYHSVCL